VRAVRIHADCPLLMVQHVIFRTVPLIASWIALPWRPVARLKKGSEEALTPPVASATREASASRESFCCIDEVMASLNLKLFVRIRCSGQPRLFAHFQKPCNLRYSTEVHPEGIFKLFVPWPQSESDLDEHFRKLRLVANKDAFIHTGCQFAGCGM